MAFVPGYSQGVSWKNGALAVVTLNITAWSWEESVMSLDVTHSGTAGIMARLAGLLDGEGTIEANVDAALLIHTLVSPVTAGAKGLITCAVGSSAPFSIPCMVQKIPWKSVVNGLVTYSFTVQLDTLSGAYVRPPT